MKILINIACGILMLVCIPQLDAQRPGRSARSFKLTKGRAMILNKGGLFRNREAFHPFKLSGNRFAEVQFASEAGVKNFDLRDVTIRFYDSTLRRTGANKIKLEEHEGKPVKVYYRSRGKDVLFLSSWYNTKDKAWTLYGELWDVEAKKRLGKGRFVKGRVKNWVVAYEVKFDIVLSTHAKAVMVGYYGKEDKKADAKRVQKIFLLEENFTELWDLDIGTDDTEMMVKGYLEDDGSYTSFYSEGYTGRMRPGNLNMRTIKVNEQDDENLKGVNLAKGLSYSIGPNNKDFSTYGIQKQNNIGHYMIAGMYTEDQDKLRPSGIFACQFNPESKEKYHECRVPIPQDTFLKILPSHWNNKAKHLNSIGYWGAGKADDGSYYFLFCYKDYYSDSRHVTIQVAFHNLLLIKVDPMGDYAWSKVIGQNFLSKDVWGQPKYFFTTENGVGLLFNDHRNNLNYTPKAGEDPQKLTFANNSDRNLVLVQIDEQGNKTKEKVMAFPQAGLPRPEFDRFINFENEKILMVFQNKTAAQLAWFSLIR